MKPKLLYIAPQNPYPPIDGGKIGIYFPIVYLSKYFDMYFAFPYNHRNLNINKVRDRFTQLGIKVFPYPHNTQNDLKYLLKNFFKREPFKWDKYYSPKFLKTLIEIIEKEKINFLLVSSPHMAKYAINLKQVFPDLKIFLREHNIEFKLVEQFKNCTKNPLYKLVASWQLKKSKNLEIKYWQVFDKVIFISDLDYNIAKNLLPNFCQKFEVLYDGYEVKIPEKGSYSKDSIIYPTNPNTIQNLVNFRWFIKEIWIPNIKVLKKRNIKLYITGDSKGLLMKTMRLYNFKNLNIVNLGFVKNINEEILKHKYVLSPTIMGSGLRLKVLNGMACGKPVFLTPLDLSTCKVFEDMVNVVCFENQSDFFKKLLRLENDEYLYLKISNNAIKTVKNHFSWDKYAEKIYTLLREYM